MKKHIIMTASDKKYGDFVIEEWYASLVNNVNLEKIDVGVLDYGLSLAQRFYLKHNGVILIPAQKDAHVTIARFRDSAHFLKNTNYDQVLSTDGGDIIFQTDISPIFEKDKKDYRAVTEEIKSAFTFFVKDKFFSKKDAKIFYKSLIFNPMINAGVLLGPRDKMISLCTEVWDRVIDPSEFGPDQIVVNYILHRDGFVNLPVGYNFVISTMKENIIIEDGVFKDQNGKIIPIVHNAGNISFFRPIENFGFGKNKNHLKPNLYKTLKNLHLNSENLIHTQKSLILTRDIFQKNIQSLPLDFKSGMSNEKINSRLNQLIKIMSRKN